MGYHRLLQNINVVRLAASVEPAVDGKGREVFQFDDFSGRLHGGGELGDSDGDEKMWCGFHTCTRTVRVIVWIRTSF